MSASKIRDAFNAVAQPQYTAQRAFLGYEPAHDVHWQRISVVGADRTGKPFTVTSELLPMDADPLEAAKALAQKLIS